MSLAQSLSGTVHVEPVCIAVSNSGAGSAMTSLSSTSNTNEES